MDILEHVNKMVDIEQLRPINGAIIRRVRELYAAKIGVFAAGDRVIWVDKGAGRHTGFVVKINRKTVQVKEDSGDPIWNIGPSLLTKI